MANEIEFEFTARLDKIEDSLKSLEDKANKTGDNITGSIIKADIIIESAKRVGEAIFSVFEKSVEKAIEGENAFNRMNQSLALAGRYSAQSSQDFANFAEQIQQTTTVGNDSAMQYLALANNFARTNEEAKKLTQAAIDLSKATGRDVESSIRVLGGSLSGVAGTLNRLVPQMRGLTDGQLRAGAAIDFVAKRFAGAAAGELNTFGGSLQFLNNLWSDFEKAIGSILITSPSVIAAIKFIGQWIGDLTDKIKDIRNNGGDIFKPLLLNAVDIAQFFVNVLGPVVDGVINTFQILGKTIGAVASAIVNAIHGDFKSAFDDLNTKINPEEFQQSGTNAGNAFLDGMRQSIEKAPPVGKDILNKAIPTPQQFSGAIGLFDNMWNSISTGATRVTQTVQSLAQTLQGSLMQGITSSFSALGAALAKGQNGFSAFAKAALAAMGAVAIQIGTVLVAAGLGWSFIPGFQASSGAIAEGLALIVIGGALQALGGGGSATPTTTASADSTQSSPVGQSATSLQQPQRQQPTSNVSVNIAGSVLGDKRTLGREIADALNEAFGTDGITIAKGAVV